MNELLDQLLEGRSPEEIMGGGGLVDELRKRLMERVLEGELTEHLGYEKAHRALGVGRSLAVVQGGTNEGAVGGFR